MKIIIRKLVLEALKNVQYLLLQKLFAAKSKLIKVLNAFFVI